MLRKLKFFILSAFLVFLTLECLLRIVLAIKIGPDILFYGIMPHKMGTIQKSQDDTAKPKRNIYSHTYKISNYTKYYPNQKRFCSDKKGNIFPVRINRYGFRGKDFEVTKPHGVLRIICLGASSTLGYGDKDDETYPYYLEEILNKEIARLNDGKNMSVEVINLGIPHLQSDQIFSLFEHEAIRLSPDIVTFYEGVDDTTIVPLDPAKLETRLLIIKVYRHLQNGWNRISNNQVNSIKNFQKYSEPRARFFIHNISRIEKECRVHNIKFYVITQQAQPVYRQRDDIRGISYSTEIAHIKDKLGKETLDLWELYFLCHSVLMKELKIWAEDNNVSVIDGIKILDNDRNQLTSWVHLTPEGNYMLAKGIADRILSDLLECIKK